MKLLQQKHSEYKGKRYNKSWVVIPHKLVKELGWEKGDGLEAEIKGDKLVIEKED